LNSEFTSTQRQPIPVTDTAKPREITHEFTPADTELESPQRQGIWFIRKWFCEAVKANGRLDALIPFSWSWIRPNTADFARLGALSLDLGF
jgi:hypothetical protein